MTALTLELANKIVSAALAKGRELGLKPLCVAVLDPGGHVIAMQREDGASILRPQMAVGKAAGALGLGISSRKIAEIAAERPTFLASLVSLSPQGLLPAAGAVIITKEESPLGAVGVTGDTADNDEICALAGVDAVSLTAPA